MWRVYLHQMWFDLKARPLRSRFQSRYMHRDFINEDKKYEILSEQSYAEYYEKRRARFVKSHIETIGTRWILGSGAPGIWTEIQPVQAHTFEHPYLPPRPPVPLPHGISRTSRALTKPNTLAIHQ